MKTKEEFLKTSKDNTDLWYYIILKLKRQPSELSEEELNRINNSFRYLLFRVMGI